MTGGQPTGGESLRDKIVSYYGGFFGTWSVAIGRRAGLLATLREHGPLTAQELANSTGCEERYVATWCRGAYAFELLEHDGDRFSITDEAAAVLLDPGDPQFMGGRGELFTMLATDFEMYPDRLVDGGTYPWADRPPAVIDAMQSATLPDAPNAIANVVPQLGGLDARLRDGARILDAGCMSGAALLAFGEAFPSAELVGIDKTARFVERARSQLGERAEIRQTDVRELPEDDAFDLIWCNVALSHTWGAGQDVIATLNRALKPGGWLLVSEVPQPATLEDLRSGTGRMFVGVMLYVALMGPGLLTQGQLREALERGGFDHVVVAEQPAPTRMMLGARKKS